MFKPITLLSFFLFFGQWLNAQNGVSFNVDSISHIDYMQLHGADLNDCWGYTDETGIEYALVGTTKGTSVVSLEDPANPQEVFWIAGSTSIWRDLQVYGDYAYVTTEAQDGLLIIDMSPLPQSNVLPTFTYTGPANNSWLSAHDIFIDADAGWAYICGANRGNGGMIILDIHTDPENPIEVGEFDNWYCHDAFSQGNLLYGAHISDGFFSIIDVTDRSAPVLLNTQLTTNTFTHNIWVTSDDHYAVTTDEVANAFLDFFDVSDPMNIEFQDKIQSSPGANVIPHNAFIKDDSLVFTSYYTDGITVHDMSHPRNVVQIGAYDTHPDQNSHFDGSWGVYPFFESGLILATDMTQGLFVLEPHIEKPCYYEGLVRNADTQVALSGVKAKILGEPNENTTGTDGLFYLGRLPEGEVEVVFFKLAFEPDTVTIDFSSGVTLTDTIDLVPIDPYHYFIHVQDQQTGLPIIDAQIRVASHGLELTYTTDGFGDAEVDVYYPGSNLLAAGKWGYWSYCKDTTLNQDNGSLTISLATGYYDDFNFDFGWQSFAIGLVTGEWERGIPYQSTNTAAPQQDAFYDCGNYCYLTGNAETIDPAEDDVFALQVKLVSPQFDLTGYTDPYIYFERYFYNYYGPGPFDDVLTTKLKSTSQTITIDETEDSIINGVWIPISIRVLDIMPLDANMQLIITTADPSPNVNITEAAFDFFMITEGSVLGTPEKKETDWKLYPNPSNGKVTISGLSTGSRFTVYDAMGKEVFNGVCTSVNQEVDLSQLKSGFYTVSSGSSIRKLVLN